MSNGSDVVPDASFNLAQALLDLAEMTEMFSGDDGAQMTSMTLRLEAVQLLDSVLRFERESLRSAADTQNHEPSDNVAQTRDIPDGEDTDLVTEHHAPTKRSCLEAALLLADAQTDIWSDQSMAPPAIQVKALADLFGEAKSLTADTTEQTEVLLAEIDGELVLEALEWQVNPKVQQSVQKLSGLLETLESSTSHILSTLSTKTQVDVGLSRADIHGLLAARLMGSQIDHNNVASAWTHLSLAIGLLNPTLQLPISAIDMPLAKSSILLDLSSLSLRRAALSETGYETALKSRPQLLANAEVYANKSLAAGGWGWLCSETVDVGIVGATSVTIPLAAGYIKEDLMERALATLIRSLLIRLHCDESVTKATQSKLTIISAKIAQMKAARGRALDPTRLAKYLEEIQRDQGQMWKDEPELWRSYISLLVS